MPEFGARRNIIAPHSRQEGHGGRDGADADSGHMTAHTGQQESEVQSVEGGRATIYRLYDVGYEIDLVRAGELLAPHAPPHPHPRRGEAAALVILQPPLILDLGSKPLTVGSATVPGSLSAAIFDFGVVSLRLRVAAPPNPTWSDYVEFGGALHGDAACRSLCDAALHELETALGPAV